MDEKETAKQNTTELSPEELSAVSGGSSVEAAIEQLRTLREKAIHAVNDTNTEVDRAAIQKEIDALIQEIDDNALLTFNKKFLNNGTYTWK